MSSCRLVQHTNSHLFCIAYECTVLPGKRETEYRLSIFYNPILSLSLFWEELKRKIYSFQRPIQYFVLNNSVQVPSNVQFGITVLLMNLLLMQIKPNHNNYSGRFKKVLVDSGSFKKMDTVTNYCSKQQKDDNSLTLFCQSLLPVVLWTEWFSLK